MSHEIRTPLNGVIGLSDLLLGPKMNGKQYEYAELINSSGRSLLFLINDILDFSKIEAGKLEIDSEAFDLPVTVESVLGILASRADDKGLDLGVFFRSGVPRIVQGDSGRLRQILLNLVGNAIKFTERGGVRIDVAVEAVRETGVSVRFEVSDTGIGIPEDRLDRLFKAFSQADTSSARVYGGTGLGLAISMKLVHLMKGEIGVQSTREKGSTFWFTAEFECDAKALECLRNGTGECNAKDCDRVDGEMCNHIAYRGFDKAYDVSGKTVLIVDENEIHRETLQNQLQSWKMNVDVCESGEAAVRFMEQVRRKGRPLDLVIFDNTLADGTGIEWARRLLGSERPEEHDRTHGILLRSLGEEYDPDFVRESAMEVVGKPVFTSALFDAVMNQLFADADRKITSEKKATGTTTRRFDVSFGQNIHFLVVEDNRVNQIVVKNLIAEAGLTCDIANNGHEACDAVRNKFYDVILMDCQMPEMDGYEATDLIRKWEHEQAKKRTPIIALTANATKEDIEKCFEAGMDAYCSKPINPGVLFETIHCLVGEILTPNVSAG